MKTTRGEQKQLNCVACGTLFAASRFDQKYCSKTCLAIAKTAYKKIAWADRSDRVEQNKRRNELYYANRIQTLEKQKQKRLQNPDAEREKHKKSYQAHKAERIEACKAYRLAHPEMRTKEYQNARRKRPWLQALGNAQHRSAKKKFAFDLTREWCERNWTGLCAVTKLPFSFGTQKHFPFSVSIDRIDSSLGYLQSNCRFVLFAINSFKGTGTDADMLLIAKAIVAQNEALDADRL